MKKRKKFFTDAKIALIVRWWSVGAVYFFIGWGTGLGSLNNVIDFVFFLGLGIGIFNILIMNPLLRRMFHLKSNIKYNDISVMEKVKRRLYEVFTSMLIVLIIVYVYSFANVLLIKMLSLSPDSVPFPGEPISFGALYIIIYVLIHKVKELLFRKKEVGGSQ